MCTLKTQRRFLPSPKNGLQRLLKFANSGMFLYRDKLYRQVDGVAMGSPLGPSLANFFLGHLEKYKIFENLNINPKLYIRYVDDIFAIFDKNISYDKFFDHINNQHPQIKFTVEKSINNSLAFLDTEIKLNGDEFESTVFRKQTNTNVLLNVDAICPVSWKKGLVLGALNRASIVCSSKVNFLSEVDKLRTIFWKNGYSKSFFNKMYNCFESKTVEGLNESSSSDNNDDSYIVKIPYVGSISYNFKNKLKQLFWEELRVDILPVFNSFKVSNYFSLKSQTPKILLSNVVYKFTGLCDTNVTYIGKTKRHLIIRCLEHLELDKPEQSEIKEHLKKCQICKVCNVDNFEILKKCKNNQESQINEAIFIKSQVPSLNKNLFNKGSLYTLKVYQ